MTSSVLPVRSATLTMTLIFNRGRGLTHMSGHARLIASLCRNHEIGLYLVDMGGADRPRLECHLPGLYQFSVHSNIALASLTRLVRSCLSSSSSCVHAFSASQSSFLRGQSRPWKKDRAQLAICAVRARLAIRLPWADLRQPKCSIIQTSPPTSQSEALKTPSKKRIRKLLLPA